MNLRAGAALTYGPMFLRPFWLYFALALAPSLARGQNVRVSASPGASVSGRMVDASGIGVAGLPIAVAPQSKASQLIKRREIGRLGYASPDGLSAAQTVTGIDGSFRVDGLRPGHYVVLTRPDNSPTLRPTHTGTVQAGEDLGAVVVVCRRLVIRVLNEHGTALPFDPTLPALYPARLARGTIVNDPARSWSSASSDLRVVLQLVEDLDEDWGDDVRWLASGDPTRWIAAIPWDRPLTLQVDSIDRGSRTVTVQLPEGQTRGSAQVALGPSAAPGRIELTVHDPTESQHVRGYRIEAWAKGAAQPTALATVSHSAAAAKGPFQTSFQLPAGCWKVRALPLRTTTPSCVRTSADCGLELPGLAEKWVHVAEASEQPLRLFTQPRGSIDVGANWRLPWSARVENPVNGEKMVGRKGTWQLAPGTYRLTLWRKDRFIVRRTIEVVAGRALAVTATGETVAVETMNADLFASRRRRHFVAR